MTAIPADYPAFSPNVVAVGGTNLYVNSNNGAPPYSYGSETAWSNSGGGTSRTNPSRRIKTASSRPDTARFPTSPPTRIQRLGSGSMTRSTTPMVAGIGLASEGRVLRLPSGRA